MVMICYVELSRQFQCGSWAFVFKLHTQSHMLRTTECHHFQALKDRDTIFQVS